MCESWKSLPRSCIAPLKRSNHSSEPSVAGGITACSITLLEALFTCFHCAEQGASHQRSNQAGCELEGNSHKIQSVRSWPYGIKQEGHLQYVCIHWFDVLSAYCYCLLQICSSMGRIPMSSKNSCELDLRFGHLNSQSMTCIPAQDSPMLCGVIAEMLQQYLSGVNKKGIRLF